MASGSFVPTGDLDGKVCTCSGDHISGCYTKTTSVQLQVLQPPREPPVLTINDNVFSGSDQNNVISVIEGFETSLTCQVEGGVPATTQTSIVCDGLPISSGSFASTRDLDGKVCTCSGDHISGIYTQTTSVQLEVLHCNIEDKLFYHADIHKCKFWQCDNFGRKFLHKCPPGTKWMQNILTCGHLSRGEVCPPW